MSAFLACAAAASALGYNIDNVIAAAQIGASAPLIIKSLSKFHWHWPQTGQSGAHTAHGWYSRHKPELLRPGTSIESGDANCDHENPVRSHQIRLSPLDYALQEFHHTAGIAYSRGNLTHPL